MNNEKKLYMKTGPRKTLYLQERIIRLVTLFFGRVTVLIE